MVFSGYRHPELDSGSHGSVFYLGDCGSEAAMTIAVLLLRELFNRGAAD